MKPSVVLLLALASAAASPAQPLMADAGCTLYEHDGAAVSGPYLAPDELASARRTGATTRVVTRGSAQFVVDYSGFTVEAQQAFQAAVDIWSNHLTSSVPIRVRATFAPLGPGVLGSAGPRLRRNFVNAPIQDVFYPFALADALAGVDLDPPDPQTGEVTHDIVATFNSTNSNFYFGLDGNPPGGPGGQFDFKTIVLHELGHGLGFVGSGARDDGAGQAECNGGPTNGCWGYFNSGGSTQFFGAIVFDTFIEDSAGRSFLDRNVYPNPSIALGDLLQSQNLFMDAPSVVQTYGGRAPVWAPASFETGSSFSHWDEVVIRNSSAALMTPSIARGEAYQDPGDITCALFSDFGWPLGSGCQFLTSDEEDALGLTSSRMDLAGPNPVRAETSFRIRLSTPAYARVRLVDALGRQVGLLFDGVAQDGAEVTVDVRSLPSGVYHVVADLGVQRATQAITVAR